MLVSYSQIHRLILSLKMLYSGAVAIEIFNSLLFKDLLFLTISIINA